MLNRLFRVDFVRLIYMTVKRAEIGRFTIRETFLTVAICTVTEIDAIVTN